MDQETADALATLFWLGILACAMGIGLKWSPAFGLMFVGGALLFVVALAGVLS